MTVIVAVRVFINACGREAVDSSFGDDVAFLSTHVETIVLGAESGPARVVVVPAWQGRVMTSTNGGNSGMSYGWLNRPLIEKGIAPENEREGLERHIYVFGGEDRFWTRLRPRKPLNSLLGDLHDKIRTQRNRTPGWTRSPGN